MDNYLILSEDFRNTYWTFIQTKNKVNSDFQQYVFEWMRRAYHEKASNLTTFVVYIFSCQMLERCKVMVNHKDLSPPLLRVLGDIFCENGRLKSPPRSGALFIAPKDLIPKTASSWFEPFIKVFKAAPEFSEEREVYSWMFGVYRSQDFILYCESFYNDPLVKPCNPATANDFCRFFCLPCVLFREIYRILKLNSSQKKVRAEEYFFRVIYVPAFVRLVTTEVSSPPSPLAII